MDLQKLPDKLAQLHHNAIFFFRGSKLIRKNYPEMFKDVQSTCEWMVRSGFEQSMRIGILAENSYEWIVCEMAILRLGCVLVGLPLEEFASSTLDQLADKYQLSALLLSEREKSRRGTGRPWAVSINKGAFESITVRKASNSTYPENGIGLSRDSDVYSFAFSSGTSGKLKCLLISKIGAEKLVDAFGENFRFDSTDSILVVLPLSNFQQRMMVYTAIWYGFDVHVAETVQFFRALKEMRPTILAGPPAFYEAVENRYRNLPSRQRFDLMEFLYHGE